MRPETLVLTGIAIIVVPFVLVVVLAIGPMGWLLLGGAFVLAGLVAMQFQDDEPDDGGPTRVNCPECGARTDDDGVCGYCGASL